MSDHRTRFDALRNRIRRRHSRSNTYDISLGANEATTLIDVDDPESVGNDDFLEHGPFNHIAVVPQEGQNSATFYTRSNRGTEVEIEAGRMTTTAFSEERTYDHDGDGVTDDTEFERGESQEYNPGDRSVNLNDETGQRYIGYIRIEAGANGFDGKVHVANDVDSTELKLLEMSGLLDVQG